MEKSEFSTAVGAWLAYTANSWQEFIVEDHYDCFRYREGILHIYHESRVRQIGDNLFASVVKKIMYSEGGKK